MPATKMQFMSTNVALSADNPLEALLPEDRLSKLKTMPETTKQEFYGRVIEGIFSDNDYKALASRTAIREFDDLTRTSQPGDMRGMIEVAVANALRRRGL